MLISKGVKPEKSEFLEYSVVVGSIAKYGSSFLTLNILDISDSIIFHWSYLKLSTTIKKIGFDPKCLNTLFDKIL